MKSYFFLIISFCLVSNSAYSMSFGLDTKSYDNLIKQIKKENIDRGYWPADVVVQLKDFKQVLDINGCGMRYFVTAVGSYWSLGLVEDSTKIKTAHSVRLTKQTDGVFTKEELEKLGVQLPINKEYKTLIEQSRELFGENPLIMKLDETKTSKEFSQELKKEVLEVLLSFTLTDGIAKELRGYLVRRINVDDEFTNTKVVNLILKEFGKNFRIERLFTDASSK